MSCDGGFDCCSRLLLGSFTKETKYSLEVDFLKSSLSHVLLYFRLETIFQKIFFKVLEIYRVIYI